MLFVPPSMPFMVPEAEAQNNSTGSGSDTTPPVVTVPSDLVFSGELFNEAGAECLTWVDWAYYQEPNLCVWIDNFTSDGTLVADIPNNPPTATDNVGVTFGPACTPDAANSVPDYDYAWGNSSNPLGVNDYPIGTTTITCVAQDAAGNVGTASFTITATVSALPAELTMTASAYLNDTSSTGRTLQLDNFNQYQETYSCHYCLVTINVQGVDVWYYIKDVVSRWQLSIPESWQPGTYTVNISENFCNYNIYTNYITCPNLDFAAASDTITVPALPAEPTITASAYLNGTSSTGRTLQLDNFNFQQETYSCNSCYVEITGQGVDVWYWVSGAVSNWQLSIPESWSAGTYTATITQNDSVVVSDTVTVPELPAEPTMTASAYLNGTSLTGRTLDIMDDYIHNGLTLVISGQGINEEYRWNTDTSGWQLSIPESWPSGSYALNFEPYHVSYGNPCVQYCSGTVTIPEYTAAEPTMTASAYLNGTSPTGRTLDIMDDYIHNSLNLVISGQGINEEYFWFSGTSGWQLSIPESWPSGSYALNFEPVYHQFLGNPCEQYCSGTVIVPELPGTETAAAATCGTGTHLEGSVCVVNQSGVVYNAPGSSTPGCEDTDSCFNPNTMIIRAGDSVTWENTDNAAHTATSGSQANGPDGIWDSSLMMVGGSYSVTLDTVGTYPYFCMVHPWMKGTVIVEPEIVIPSWIKNNAGWWASNQIDDGTFVSGLQWLISNGIMNIPPTEQGAGSDDVIPGWIKNNAGWWADDLIDDRNFVTGLQWLITNGIMVIG